MAKHLSQVTAKQKEKPMVIGRDFLIKADRAARRQAAIEAGLLHPCGTGVHGGCDKERNRRTRQDWRRKLRRGDCDE